MEKVKCGGFEAVNSMSCYELTAVAILRVRSTNFFTSVRIVALGQ